MKRVVSIVLSAMGNTAAINLMILATHGEGPFYAGMGLLGGIINGIALVTLAKE